MSMLSVITGGKAKVRAIMTSPVEVVKANHLPAPTRYFDGECGYCKKWATRTIFYSAREGATKWNTCKSALGPCSRRHFLDLCAVWCARRSHSRQRLFSSSSTQALTIMFADPFLLLTWNRCLVVRVPDTIMSSSNCCPRKDATVYSWSCPEVWRRRQISRWRLLVTSCRHLTNCCAKVSDSISC